MANAYSNNVQLKVVRIENKIVITVKMACHLSIIGSIILLLLQLQIQLIS